MDHIVNIRVLLEDFVKRSLVCDIALVEGRSFAADQLDAVDDLCGRIVKVVNDDNLVVSLEEGEGCE